jgi:cadmium resistance protein CadD (predicted permease)
MIAMAFASAAVAIVAGFVTDDGAVLILGFMCALLGVACLFHRDYDRNAHASESLAQQLRRIGTEEDRS